MKKTAGTGTSNTDSAKKEYIKPSVAINKVEDGYSVVLTNDKNSAEAYMIKCPAGKFVIANIAYFSDVAPKGILNVTISKDFYIGKYPVTQGLYNMVMGPASFLPEGDNYPAEPLSWFKAKEFCDRLNELTNSIRPEGYEFNLPTEAQWEYACRAGTTTSFNNGKDIEKNNIDGSAALDEVGWYEKNSGGKLQPVGKKKPNAWGIYDMHGNTYEWCRDWDFKKGSFPGSPIDPEGPGSGTYRVCRGGTFKSLPIVCASDYRNHFLPETESEYVHLGFRLALVPVSK